MKRFLRRLGAALLALLLLAALAVAVYLWRASPQASGSQQVVGVTAAITIERDAMGVPTVRAQNAEDLAFGLGYVHAQDRAWQLESQRRIANGELAEAFGSSVLDTDRFLRALGVKRAAAARWAWMQRQTDATTAQSRAVVEAYSRGINAALNNQARPPEMVILGLPTRDWTPVDTLAWHTMMAWDLSGNWTQELLRLRMALQLPPARANLDGLNALFPPYAGEKPLLQTDLVPLYRGLGLGRDGTAEKLARLASAAPLSGVEGAGSNNWLVDGGRSDNGHVLVANDPHLKLQSPSLWYLARLEAPGVRVAGGTLPGLPFVVLGQNEQVAWAFTNTGPDTQDLYLEELRDTPQGTQVRTPEGWTAPQVIEEEIRIKGGTTETLRVRVGRHGPFISDAGAGADLLGNNKRYALALRWVALDTAHDPIAGGLALNRARSIDDFVAANRLFLSPMQSILAGDRAGNTAFVAAARVPVRRADNDLHGLAPAPGWDARYDWTGFIPFEHLPQERNPGRGWMATANQRVVPPDYPHFLTSEWASPYRQQRIQQLMAAQIKHNLDTFAAMQGDQVSLAARPLLPLLNAAHSDHALAPAARAALQGFSGDMRADTTAPLIFWAWVRQLTIGVLQDDLGDALFERSFGSRSFRDTLEGIVTRNDAAWCDDQRTPAAESCVDQSSAAFTRALTELQARFGADVGQWRWGEAHQAKGEHRPFSRVAALRPFFEVKTPVGGDTYTLNVARVLLKPDWAGDLYTDDHGPGLRTLMDAGNPQASRFVTSTGQSGLPWSRHYRDQVPLWTQVRYLPLWPEAPAQHSLTLRP